MASVWPPEILIVYHRRNQGGGKGAIGVSRGGQRGHAPLIFRKYSDFLL